MLFRSESLSSSTPILLCQFRDSFFGWEEKKKGRWHFREFRRVCAVLVRWQVYRRYSLVFRTELLYYYRDVCHTRNTARIALPIHQNQVISETCHAILIVVISSALWCMYGACQQFTIPTICRLYYFVGNV